MGDGKSAAQNNLYSGSNFLKNTPNKYGDYTIDTTVIYGNKEYNVWKNGDAYYILLNGQKYFLTNADDIKAMKQNDLVCRNISEVSDTPFIGKSNGSASSTKTEETKEEVKAPASAGTYNPPATPTYDDTALKKEIQDLKDKLAEATRVRSAAELAEHYGIDYNLENILADYNQRTNDYYDEAVQAQNDIRTDYARNNGRYVDDIVGSYLDSYKNTAQTAANRGMTSANALASYMSGNAINSQADYGMLQSVNDLEEARKAELEANPNTARSYYNSIGSYLSNLSANLNASDVQNYINELDAYTQRYQADRTYQGYLAQAATSKYAGLAGAAQNNAYSAAQNGSTYQSAYDSLYNYFLATNGGSTTAAKRAMGNLFMNSTGTY